jgi:DNA-binding transcriptional LysR family regulator
VELRQLEHFVAVVEEGSFTRAAARLYMVQSSLSASLLALERELGTELFVRGHRGAELTDAGHAFEGPARTVLRETGNARDAVAQATGLLRGTARIATVPVPRSVDLGETIRRFQDEHPGVEVQVVRTGTSEVGRLVAAGQVDFGIAPPPKDTGPRLPFEPVLSTPLVVVCPGGHPLAGRQDLDAGDLVPDQQVIDLPRGWRARELFDELVEQHGARRPIRLEVDDWLEVLSMVSRGLGVAYGPEACIDRMLFGELGVARLRGAPVWELGVLSRDPTLRGAAGRALLDAYRTRCRVSVDDAGSHVPDSGIQHMRGTT